MREVIPYLAPEDGGWVASVPSRPGCHTQGNSREEALANARSAIEDWNDMARLHGDPIKRGTLRSILRDAGISAERFRELLD